MANRFPALDQLRLAATDLAPLLDDIVFLGGCTTGLFITDPAAPGIRATEDVDVITEVAGIAGYRQLENQLRELGFDQHEFDPETTPICRWFKGKLVVDVMPTDPAILGFANRWYAPAIANAYWEDLGKGLRIKLVTAPYFMGTKIEAFEGRGNGDFLASQDMEDMIAVIDGRPGLIEDLRGADAELRQFVAEGFKNYLGNEEFRNALPGLLGDSAGSASRERILLNRLDAICQLD